MRILENKTVKEEKASKLRSIIDNLNELKLDSFTFNEAQDSSEVEEIIRIENFNGSLEDLRTQLEVAYDCLFNGINNQ